MIPNQDLGHETGLRNAAIIESLDSLPDLLSDAYIHWQNYKEAREMAEAKFCLELKAKEQEKTATEIKWAVSAETELYKMRLHEILLEGEYMRLQEKHLANKKKADMVSAF